MLTKPLILNTAVFQKSFGPAFEQCRLLPAKREGFRKLTKQIAQTVMVFRRPLNKRPTRKILDVHKQHLRFADKQEKANCLINEILYLDLIEKLPKHLHWINSAERVIWLASVVDEPSRDDLYPNHMKQVGYCEVADGRLAIEWARGIIERDFVGDYKAWRRLR